MKFLLTIALLPLSILTASAQDYKAYDALLKKYVTPSGVKYTSWAANKEDHTKLNGILKDWGKVDANKLSKNDKAAFRINLYNAAMVGVVLDRYPIKSVTNLGIPFSIFKKKLITTPSGKISLDTLEKKQLLGDFPDHRIHFAVNCASISCPPLRNEAYRGKKLEQQLQDQAITFSNSDHAYTLKKGKARYSSLLKWYKKDFGNTHPAVTLNKYRKDKLSTKTKPAWINYNWGLNTAQSSGSKK